MCMCMGITGEHVYVHVNVLELTQAADDFIEPPLLSNCLKGLGRGKDSQACSLMPASFFQTHNPVL